MNNRSQDAYEAPHAELDGPKPSVMCSAECQRHPIGTLAHTARKLAVLDGRVARMRTKANKEVRGQLLVEMEGLAVVAAHDLMRLLWDLRGGYRETYAD